MPERITGRTIKAKNLIKEKTNPKSKRKGKIRNNQTTETN